MVGCRGFRWFRQARPAAFAHFEGIEEDRCPDVTLKASVETFSH